MNSKKLMTDELLCILYSILHNYAYVDSLKAFLVLILISLAKKIMTFLDFFCLFTFLLLLLLLLLLLILLLLLLLSLFQIFLDTLAKYCTQVLKKNALLNDAWERKKWRKTDNKIHSTTHCTEKLPRDGCKQTILSAP